jgi:hypothetical protein
MIAFARAHKIALWAEFIVVALSVLAIPVAGEPWGWMMVFGSLPWSIAATALPGTIGLAIIAVGLGFNVVLATIVIFSGVSWWLKTLRYDNDT